MFWVQYDMASRTRDTAFTRAFEVNIVLMRDVEDGISLISFNGLECVAFGVPEVDFNACPRGWTCYTTVSGNLKKKSLDVGFLLWKTEEHTCT